MRNQFRARAFAAASVSLAAALLGCSGEFPEPGVEAEEAIELERIAPAYQQLTARSQGGETLRIIAKLGRPHGAASGALSSEEAFEQALGAVSHVGHVAQKTLPRLNVAVYEVTPGELNALLESGAVVHAEEDIAVPPTLAQSIPWIGGNIAHNGGATGAGQAIAILDTGVEAAHPAFGGRVVEEACFSSAFSGTTSFCPGGEERAVGPGTGGDCSASGLDPCYHGTHVAGIAAGAQGVAPQANLISAQVFSRVAAGRLGCNSTIDCVLSYTSDQVAALDWVLQEAQTANIVAVNMSLGGDIPYTEACDTNSLMAEAIGRLRAAGIAVVIASGNNGFNNAVSAPACVSAAITVGNTWDDQDRINFDSNSSSLVDLLAPGTFITSAAPGGTTRIAAGTSMAAPHVAGAFALLGQTGALNNANPSLRVDDGERWLEEHGTPVFDGRTSRTYPRLALNAMGPAPTPGTFLEAECPSSAQGSYTTTRTTQAGFTGRGHLTSLGNTTAALPTASTDRAQYQFSVPTAGTYNLYFRIDTNGSVDDDSWYWSIDNGAYTVQNNHNTLGDGFAWALNAGNTLTLSAGTHTLNVANRESGLSLDKIAVLPVGTAAPVGAAAAATNCPVLPVCGNGTLEAGEACDDGNSVNTDACTNLCVAARCGDGIVRSGSEACDDGNSVNTDGCSNSCSLPSCGDAVCSATESCSSCATDCGTCPVGPSAVYLEAECATTTQGAYGTVQTSRGGYSGNGHLISVANNTANPFNNTSLDRASYAVNIATAGNYAVYFRAHGNANANDDSWFYQVDNGAWITMNNSTLAGWNWYAGNGNAVVTLSAGTHTLRIANRENGLGMDKLALIPQGTAIPTGLGGTASNCAAPTPSFPIFSATFDNYAAGNTDQFFFDETAFQSPSAFNGQTNGIDVGQLNVTMGLNPSAATTPNSAAYGRAFQLSSRSTVTVSLTYSLAMADGFEAAECGEVRVKIGNTYYGTGGNAWVVRRCDGGNNAGSHQFTTAALAAGSYTLQVGGYLNDNSAADEIAIVRIDNVVVTGQLAP